MHFRGGLHLLYQKSATPFKHLSLKHSFYCSGQKKTKEKQKTLHVVFPTTKTKKTKEVGKKKTTFLQSALTNITTCRRQNER